MGVQQTTPPEAHATLTADPAAVYLDVRTPEEFAAGHPAGARNVPVVFLQGPGRPPVPNADFVAIVETHFPRDTKILIGCQSGGRSQRAADILVQAGYANVTNVQGGFGGARDRSGQVVVVGWREAGLPVERGATAGASYDDLAAKK
jgi:rhodanese-related sulfurtransferase